MTLSVGTQIFNGVGDSIEKSKNGKFNNIVDWWRREFKVILAEFVSTMLLLFLGCMTTVPLSGFDIQPPMYSPIAFGMIWYAFY